MTKKRQLYSLLNLFSKIQDIQEKNRLFSLAVSFERMNDNCNAACTERNKAAFVLCLSWLIFIVIVRSVSPWISGMRDSRLFDDA